MRVPTIHSNGTSKEALTRQVEEAARALRIAMEKLAEAAPHGRDYYLQGPSAIKEATDEFLARMNMLRLVRDELTVLHEKIVDQGGE